MIVWLIVWLPQTGPIIKVVFLIDCVIDCMTPTDRTYYKSCVSYWLCDWLYDSHRPDLLYKSCFLLIVWLIVWLPQTWPIIQVVFLIDCVIDCMTPTDRTYYTSRVSYWLCDWLYDSHRPDLLYKSCFLLIVWLIVWLPQTGPIIKVVFLIDCVIDCMTPTDRTYYTSRVSYWLCDWLYDSHRPDLLYKSCFLLIVWLIVWLPQTGPIIKVVFLIDCVIDCMTPTDRTYYTSRVSYWLCDWLYDSYRPDLLYKSCFLLIVWLIVWLLQTWPIIQVVFLIDCVIDCMTPTDRTYYTSRVSYWLCDWLYDSHRPDLLYKSCFLLIVWLIVWLPQTGPIIQVVFLIDCVIDCMTPTDRTYYTSRVSYWLCDWLYDSHRPDLL